MFVKVDAKRVTLPTYLTTRSIVVRCTTFCKQIHVFHAIIAENTTISAKSGLIAYKRAELLYCIQHLSALLAQNKEIVVRCTTSFPNYPLLPLNQDNK
ncbi:hypothetical protein ASG85_11710 [Paenibacillus sp. Soil724D2]|nr:hypothetical protein ASG85_11710 [Paenibacillus sp. Soil724D2]